MKMEQEDAVKCHANTMEQEMRLFSMFAGMLRAPHAAVANDTTNELFCSW